MSKLVGDEDYSQDQANAICYGRWEESVYRSKEFFLYEVTAAEDPDLEAYRVQALAELEEDIIPTLYSLVESVLGQRPAIIQPIGSILDPDRFHEDSDIDVGVYFQQDGEMSEYYSGELQKEMIRYPFGMLGVLNTVVFGEPRTREESVNNNRKALNERVTPADLSQVETYVDKLFDKVGVDVEFTRHFLDRVNDKRNKKPITTAELIRIFRETYKKHGKKIPELGPEAQAVLQDLKTDVNIPFALEVDKNGDLDLISKTVMRKKGFKTSNPTLTVENTSMEKVNSLNPKNILERISSKKLEEGINSDTVSKKFFQQLLDTLEDIEDDDQLSEDERCRIMAQLMNAEAKKYLKPAQWKGVVSKLYNKYNGGGGDEELTEPAPEQPEVPPSTISGFASPARFGESAPSVEFYTDGMTGNVRAIVSHEGQMSLKELAVKESSKPEGRSLEQLVEDSVNMAHLSDDQILTRLKRVLGDES